MTDTVTRTSKSNSPLIKHVGIARDTLAELLIFSITLT